MFCLAKTVVCCFSCHRYVFALDCLFIFLSLYFVIKFIFLKKIIYFPFQKKKKKKIITKISHLFHFSLLSLLIQKSKNLFAFISNYLLFFHFTLFFPSHPPLEFWTICDAISTRVFVLHLFSLSTFFHTLVVFSCRECWWIC